MSRPWEVLHGDCLERMRDMPDASVDAIVCDPPYGLEFMGKDWDHGIPGVAFWREALRVAKPGAHLIAAGGTRTFHRLACAIEDAGWEIRDTICWLYGAGFPKSLNVNKALAAAGYCGCDVANHARSVHPPTPAGDVAATVGAEPGAAPLDGDAANLAWGLVAESSGSAGHRRKGVERWVEPVGGNFEPVMLGPLDVTGVADGEEVVHPVGLVESNPESLRDEVVCDEPVGGPTVGAPLVPGNNGVRNDTPAPPLVWPTATSPSRVADTSQTFGVMSGHAGSGAVDPGSVTPTPSENGAALLANVGDSHATNLMKCGRCGKPVANVPQGLGTALKPAFEPWILARKPLVGTVAANVAAHGTGALNVDGCRIGIDEGERAVIDSRSGAGFGTGLTVGAHQGREEGRFTSHTAGRWPANVILGCNCGGDNGAVETDDMQDVRHALVSQLEHPVPDMLSAIRGLTHKPDCAVAMLDAQSGERGSFIRNGGLNGRSDYGHHTEAMAGDFAQTAPFNYGDTGGASRFFYCAKASRKEREAGLEGMPERQHVEGEYPDYVHPVPPGLGHWLKAERERAGLSRKQVAGHFLSKTGGLTGCVTNWEEEFNRPTPEQWQTLRTVIGFNDRHDVAMTELRSIDLAQCDNPYLRAQTVRTNSHPTVKPIALMRWLCKLVTPPNGLVFDPFTGSGSTGIAAVTEGFRFLGIEQDADYAAIAEVRLAYWERVARRYHRLLAYRAAHPVERTPIPADPRQASLFEEVA